MSNNLTRSEILEQAATIRESAPVGDAPHILTAEESNVIRQADMIINERRASGIGGVIDAALAAIRGERATAEAALERARRGEAAAEALLAERAGLEKSLLRQREVLVKLKEMAASAASRATAEAEEEHFLSRFAHADHYLLPDHLRQVAIEIVQNRIVAQYAQLYVERQNGAVAEAETRVKEISKQVSKL